MAVTHRNPIIELKQSSRLWVNFGVYALSPHWVIRGCGLGHSGVSLGLQGSSIGSEVT